MHYIYLKLLIQRYHENYSFAYLKYKYLKVINYLSDILFLQIGMLLVLQNIKFKMYLVIQKSNLKDYDYINKIVFKNCFT
jgi:hypothetical protein